MSSSEKRVGVKRSLHWFRKGLRLSDNPALLRTLKRAETFRCIFIVDPSFASNVGVNKWRFLLDSLKDLDNSLRKLNSRLFVIRGQPSDVLPKLFKEWRINYFTFEEDPEPYAKIRDSKIQSMCHELGVYTKKEPSHTLFDLEKIISLNNGKAPSTYKEFLKIVEKLGEPKSPLPALNLSIIGNATTPISHDHDEKYGVPTLNELGFRDCSEKGVWVGGESEAIKKLERHLERKAWIASFGRHRMRPQSLLNAQTGLSCYLRFGCLSPRLFYHSLNDLYKKLKHESPPMILYSHLLWRELFYTASTQNRNFDRMKDNPICLQIPWDDNPQALAKWAMGKTGFPWIDAIMNQLRSEGWIHHICRHAVACFLTRGDLWLSWESGMKVFDELLLDADLSVNAGMWLWLSSSSFFQQFFPIYCPVKFAKKADPNGDYIRKYVPALKNMPTKFIHEPWLAPIDFQQNVKCVIGKDYPTPMVDHDAVSVINQERLRQVFKQLLSYNDKNIPDSRQLERPLELTDVSDISAIEKVYTERTNQNITKFKRGVVSSIHKKSEIKSKNNSAASGSGTNKPVENKNVQDQRGENLTKNLSNAQPEIPQQSSSFVKNSEIIFDDILASNFSSVLGETTHEDNFLPSTSDFLGSRDNTTGVSQLRFDEIELDRLLKSFSDHKNSDEDDER